MSDFRERAVSGVFWSFIDRWGQTAASTVVFVVLARLLQPEDFGLLALATVFTAFLGIFRDQGLGMALIQKEELDEGDLDTGFWTIAAGGVVLTAIGIGVAGPVSEVLDEPLLAPVVRWLSLGLTLTALGGTHDAILRRELDFRSVTIRSLVGTASGGIVGIGMALYGFGVWSLVGQSLVGAAAKTIALWGLTDWRPSATFRWRSFVELYRFGLNIIGTNVASFVNKRSDDFFIGMFLDSTALGYYSVGYKIVERAKGLIGAALNQAAFAAFSRLQSDLERFRSAFYEAVELSAALALPLFLVGLVAAPELIEVVFGEKWLAATPVFRLLSVAAVAHVLEYVNLSVLLAVGRPDWKLRLTVVYAVLNVAVFITFARFGIVAVALAFAVRSYATMPLSYWLTRKAIRFSLGEYLRRLAVPLLASLGTVAAAWSAKSLLAGASAWMVLGALGGLAVIVYPMAIRLGAPGLFQRAVGYVRLFVRNARR